MRLERYSTCNYSEFDFSSTGEWVKASDAEALENENEKLKRACSVLYFGSEEYLRKLAENEYSGCASTQRKELKELLEGK